VILLDFTASWKEWDICAQFRIKKQKKILQIRVSNLQVSGQIWPAKLFQPGHEGISSGRVDILSIMKKQYIYETFVDLVECNLFWNSYVTRDVWPTNCCAVAHVALWQESLETPAVDQWVVNHYLYRKFVKC